MPNPVARALGISKHTPYLDSFMDQSNMEVMRRVTPVIAALSGLVLVSTFTQGVFWRDRPQDILLCYRIQCLCMFAIGLLYRLVSVRYLASPKPRPHRGEWHLMSFVVLLTAINLWITLVDYAMMGRYFFLLVALFTLFGLFFIRPACSLVCLVLVFAITMGGLSVMGLMAPIQVITLLSYLVIIFIVSSANYVARLRVGMSSERIVNASRRDELTGVLNRRAFDEDARTYVGQDVYVVLADIDDFKYYNDLHGHAMGDQLLRVFAESLVNTFGAGRVYHFAGDEFIVVFPSVDENRMRELVRAWRQSFGRRVSQEHQMSTTCSAGCVRGAVASEEDVHDLLRIADVLLFRSKRDGRDRATFAEYSDGLLREAITKSSASEVPEESIDPLTGLLVHDYFIEHVSETAPVLLQKGHSVSFVYFNVANLKDYNAQYGYAQGDELLKQVAKTLGEVFPGRMVSRFGEDRFVLMTDDAGLPEAIGRACSLVREAQHGKLTSLQAGVCRYTSPDVEVRHACDCARVACRSLRGNYDVLYRYYTNELGEQMRRRAHVLERFGNALEQGHIQPYYQPIVRAKTGAICEFEVLARWIDPREGFMSPVDFVPALEDAHLVHLLDLHIVECVCQNFRRLADAGRSLCPVSVNFSRLDFEACDLPTEVVGLLDRYGLPHHLIRVELTESAFAQDTLGIQRMLDRFHAAGMQVWMDDFGSGYSSLNALREYRFDLVKFDMIFLNGLDPNDPHDAGGIILTRLVGMARDLGLQTLIEGVETEDQLGFLCENDFDKIQGYVFDRPCSFDDVCQKIDDHRYRLE